MQMSWNKNEAKSLIRKDSEFNQLINTHEGVWQGKLGCNVVRRWWAAPSHLKFLLTPLPTPNKSSTLKYYTVYV